MDHVEGLLRDALSERAAAAPDGAGLLDAVHARVARRRRGGRATTTVAALVVVVLIVAVVAAIGSGNGSPGRATSPVATQPRAPQPSGAPAGQRLISFHGVEVLVPTAWNAPVECNAALGNTVIVEDGATLSCGRSQAPGFMIATIGLARPATEPAIPTHPVKVYGHAATRGTGTIHPVEIVAGSDRSAPTPERFAALEIPDVGVRVTVQGPDAAAATRLLDSVRVVKVDAFGCDGQVASLTPARPSARPGSARTLVPGTPTGATICRYSDDWQAASVPLVAPHVQSLVRLFNVMPAGVSQQLGHEQGTPAACAEELRRGFIVHFTYASGSPLLVFVRVGGCAVDPVWAKNGSRTSQINDRIVSTLVNAAGYDGGIAQLSLPGFSNAVLVITPHSLGPVVVGMLKGDAQISANRIFGTNGGFIFPTHRPVGFPNDYVQFGADGRVLCVGSRIVDASALTQKVVTREGLRLGDPVSRLLHIYGSHARYVPSPTTGPPANAGYVVSQPTGNLVFTVDPHGLIVNGIVGGGHDLGPDSCRG